MPQLATFLNRERLGTVTLQEQEERYELSYAASWLKGPNFAVSPHLLPGKPDSGAVKRFLANLLPEGKWLEELSVAHQISKSNIFGLIALLGAETTGALSFQFEGEKQEAGATDFRPVGLEELQERIARRQQVSIINWDGKPRLSVAGVQDKLPILIKPTGEMGFGEGELASTHILKFGREPALHMAINELFCMLLARRVMLPAAKAFLERWGEPVLRVERFDRKWKDEKVDRLHLIDGCQLLDLPPIYKYERPFGKHGEAARIRSGASLAKLFEACNYCRIPAQARRDLLNWVLFQLLIENSDAHAKNISFFVNENGIDLAPAYDLLNVGIYGEEFEVDLAMAVGDEFVLSEILPYQMAEMCDECKLPQRLVADKLKNLCQKILKSLNDLPFDILEGQEVPFALTLVGRIRANAERFSKIAEELPRVRL